MRAVALAVCYLVVSPTQPQMPQDAAAILSEMRQALGGDAALARVTAFQIEGSSTRSLGARRIESSLELLCELPDHCLRSTTQSNGPFFLTMTDGFTGDEPIRSIASSGRTPPVDVYMGPNTPEAIAASRRRTAIRNKQEFARILLALFGNSPGSYPVTFSLSGPDSFGGREMESLEAKGDDGFSMRLLVDRQTHLPAAVVWKAPVVAVMTTSQSVAVGRRTGEVRDVTPPAVTPPPALPPGAISVNGAPTPDPAAGQPLVDHAVAFTDFKTEDGLTWPRRITETADGHPLEDMRFRSVRINPKIDPRRFKPQTRRIGTP